MRSMGLGRIGPALLLFTVLTAGSASAYDANDPHNCNGVHLDDKRALVVQKVTARPRVNFIKSPYDNDFKAETCPAATEACRKKSSLVTGDLLLTGKTLGAFTCVDYQSPLAKKQIWARGWLPSAALTPVAPMASPKISDWIGTWYHPGGPFENTYEGECRVRMQRIGPWLMVEDNDSCGGAGVTFSGLYRRKR